MLPSADHFAQTAPGVYHRLPHPSAMTLLKAAALLLAFASAGIVSSAQTAKGAASELSKPRMFKDDEVRIPIPAGWKRTYQFSPSTHNSFQGFENDKPHTFPITGTLLLEKDGYTLTLAYATGQASGIMGGRSIEVFNIPWSIEPPGDLWSCADSFEHVPQPASRTLLFENLIVDTTQPHIREDCAVADLTNPAPNAAGVRSTGAQRWFGGYFTTFGGYFFGEWPGDDHLYERSYCLTTSAKTINDLPMQDNAHLAEIIQQAIDIVDSITYKKHPLKPISPLRANVPAS